MPNSPLKVSDAFGGFLEAEDLPDGKEIAVTIEAVRMSNKDDKGQDGRPIETPVLKIAKVKKEWILNKTNARAIRRLHGNEMTAWAGHEITIYRTTCNAFGNPHTPCIRVRGNTL